MTGWTWDYARHSLTFKRYEALKKSWHRLPPLPVTVFAIARAFGMEAKDESNEVVSDAFYDESYYENTAATPWQTKAATALSADFAAASGVKT